MKTLKCLFMEELKDRYDSEKQLVQAMPQMIAASKCEELKETIQAHLEETKEQITKLEKVFECCGEKPTTKKCAGTAGLLKEAQELTAEFKNAPAIDAAIVSLAQKIEHYEIASYGCLVEWAKLMENNEAADILQEILDQEGDANKALIEVAISKCNEDALATDGSDKCSKGEKPGIIEQLFS